MIRISTSPWTRRLLRNIDCVLRGGAAEDVHQLRVAIARLRVWLSFAGMKTLRDELRWLRRKTAAVRDLDVQLEQEPPRRLAAILARRRDRAYRRLLRVLGARRAQRVLLALEKCEPVSREAAEKTARLFGKCAMRRASQVRWDKPRLEDLHALRRAVRRVRYALEWLGEDNSKLLAELQEALGDACDRRLALRVAAAHRQKRGMRRHRARLKRQLARETERAAASWERARALVKRIATGSASARSA